MKERRMSRPFPMQSLAAALTLAVPAGAFAAPAAGSAYRTDAQNTHVEDATSRGIGTVNMITCIMSALRADALVNQGTYLALVDESKCDSEKDAASQSSGSSGTAPSYMLATVQSTRGSNDEPMRMKAWLSQPQEDEGVTIFVNLAATSAPTPNNPYGDFRIDYCGSPDSMPGVCIMNGYLIGSAAGIQYFELEQGDHGPVSKALAMTRSGDDGGSGRLSYQEEGQPAEYMFAYDASHFRRATGVQDRCFSRLAQEADASVWRYGLYDGAGARLERQSGFPIQYDGTNGLVRGYMGYWGLSVPGDAVPPADGATVYKVDYGNDGATRTAYTYAGVAGRLSKYTKAVKPLAQVDGVRISLWANDRSEVEGGSDHGPGQYEIAWQQGAGNFRVMAAVACDNGPCVSRDLTTDVRLGAAYFATRGGLRGYSQALGGEVFVPVAPGSTAIASDAVVNLRVQSLVYPGDMPAQLECLNNCPTAASLQAYFAPSSSVASPYAAGTAFSYQPASTTVAYTTSAGVLRSGADTVVWTDRSSLQQRPQYMGGVRSGRLFTPADKAALLCQGSGSQNCDYRTEELPDYYVWETGSNPYNQFAALRDGNGQYVAFQAPLNVDYTVPTDGVYGGYAGRSLVLQYSGFGELWGIPGQCVSRDDNQAVSCDQPGARYVPAFVVPYDTTTGTVSAGGSTYYAKWLDRELRFRSVAGGQCSALPLPSQGSLPLPTAQDLHNPSDSTAAYYIGARPVIDAGTAPRVIHGEVKF
jgi:hypothetical protein